MSVEPVKDTAAKNRARRKFRRRVSAGLLLLIALVVAGGLASTFTPTLQVAVADEDKSALLRTGKQLYETSCITCHGANLQGVPDRRPSLIGVGEARCTSRSPPDVCRPCAMRLRPSARTRSSTRNRPTPWAPTSRPTAAPQVIRDRDGAVAQESLRGNNIARGGDLFRLNCASCHNFTGRGGALSSGKFAPELDPATEQQIYTAMLTGPQNMPKFSDRQLTVDEKKDIIAYVRASSETPTRAVTAWAASDRRPRAWPCGSSASSPPSPRHCGLEHARERE